MSPTALPSVSDAIVVVVLLVPGFVCFVLFRRIAVVEAVFSDFETTVWSLGISAMMYGVFSYLTGITDIDTLSGNFFQPLYLTTFIWILGSGLLLAGLAGVVVRETWMRGTSLGDIWDWTKDLQSQWVTVYTTDGLEYRGQLFGVGFGRSRHELLLKNPKQIVRDRNWKPALEIPRGDAMVFTEGDIRRVAVYLKP